MTSPRRLAVLYEDNHLLVVEKPPGLPTQGALPQRPSLLAAARQYLKQKYRRPGNVYLGVVSRLDSPVSGITVFARTSKAARRLNEQFRSRTVRKYYWVLVEGEPAPPEAECVDSLRHDDRQRRVHVTQPGDPNGQEARMRYRRLKTFRSVSLLEVELLTGRKHQIRVQLAHRGWPVVGDRKYGSRRGFPAGIALHARRLVFVHPVKGDTLDLVAALPDSWKAFVAGGLLGP